MTPEINWRNKSLENLEKKKWPGFESDSRLMRRIKEIRKIPLESLSVEDLRLMIGQNAGLDYLIPLALEKLRIDILAEGDFYRGDLLLAVINSSETYWNNSPLQKNELIKLVAKNKEIIEQEGIDIQF